MADADSTRERNKKSERATYYKKWRAANKAKLKAYGAAYYKENKDRMNAEAARRYRENPERYKARASMWMKENRKRRYEIADAHRRRNPKRYREYRKAAYERNKEQWLERSRQFRAEHPELMRQLQADWKARNPEACAYHVGLRRTRKMQATPAWADLRAIKVIYTEAARLRKETGEAWHVDHDIPLKHPLVCGLHVHTNLRVIPAIQNHEKKNKFKVAA